MTGRKRTNTFTPLVEESLKRRLTDYNRMASPGRRATLSMLKAVYRRGTRAYSSADTVLTRDQFALGRVASFVKLLNDGHPENTRYVQDFDLLPAGHPRNRSHRARTTGILIPNQRRVSLADVAVEAKAADAQPVLGLIAAAAPLPVNNPLRQFLLMRALVASDTSPELFRVSEQLRALVADGNSAMARRLRAMRQLRDRHGRWIEMGGGIRFKFKGAGSSAPSWVHGVAEGVDVPNGRVDVRLEDGKLVKVPANKVEAIKAVLPGPNGLTPGRTAPTPEAPAAPGGVDREDLQARALQDKAAHALEGVQEQLMDQGDYYSVDDLLRNGGTLNDDLREGMDQARPQDKVITIKPPSGSEIGIPRDVAQAILDGTVTDMRRPELKIGDPVKSGRTKGTITADVTPVGVSTKKYEVTSKDGKKSEIEGYYLALDPETAAADNPTPGLKPGETDDPNAPTVDETKDTAPATTGEATTPETVPGSDINAAATEAATELMDRVPDNSTMAGSRDQLRQRVADVAAGLRNGSMSAADGRDELGRVSDDAAAVATSSGDASDTEREAFKSYAEDIDNVASLIDDGMDYSDPGAPTQSPEAAPEPAAPKPQQPPVNLDALEEMSQNLREFPEILQSADPDFGTDVTAIANIADNVRERVGDGSLDNNGAADLLERASNRIDLLFDQQPDAADRHEDDLVEAQQTIDQAVAQLRSGTGGAQPVADLPEPSEAPATSEDWAEPSDAPEPSPDLIDSSDIPDVPDSEIPDHEPGTEAPSGVRGVLDDIFARMASGDLEAEAPLPDLVDALNGEGGVGGDYGNYTYKVDRARVTAPGNDVEFEMSITDKQSGQVVGRAHRYFQRNPDGTPFLYLAEFMINDDFQGGGIGSEVLRRHKEMAIAAGMSHMELEADMSVGGYAWARAGFQWNPDAVTSNEISNMLDMIEANNEDNHSDESIDDGEFEDVKAEIDALRQKLTAAGDDPTQWPTPYELAGVGEGYGYGDSAGKMAMQDSSWQGIMPLNAPEVLAHSEAHTSWVQSHNDEVPAERGDRGDDYPFHHVDADAPREMQQELSQSIASLPEIPPAPAVNLTPHDPIANHDDGFDSVHDKIAALADNAQTEADAEAVSALDARLVDLRNKMDSGEVTGDAAKGQINALANDIEDLANSDAGAPVGDVATISQIADELRGLAEGGAPAPDNAPGAPETQWNLDTTLAEMNNIIEDMRGSTQNDTAQQLAQQLEDFMTDAQDGQADDPEFGGMDWQQIGAEMENYAQELQDSVADDESQQERITAIAQRMIDLGAVMQQTPSANDNWDEPNTVRDLKNQVERGVSWPAGPERQVAMEAFDDIINGLVAGNDTPHGDPADIPDALDGLADEIMRGTIAVKDGYSNEDIAGRLGDLAAWMRDQNEAAGVEPSAPGTSPQPEVPEPEAPAAPSAQEDMFGNAVPDGWTLANDGDDRQRYTLNGSDLAVDVTHAPSRFRLNNGDWVDQGDPVFIIRRGDGRPLANVSSWDQVATEATRLEQSRQGVDESRARTERFREQERTRLEERQRQVAEIVQAAEDGKDINGNDMPDGWSLTNDRFAGGPMVVPGSSASYQKNSMTVKVDTDGNMKLFQQDPYGNLTEVGTYTDWPSVEQGINEHRGNQSVEQRATLARQLEEAGFGRDAVDAAGEVQSAEQVREIIEADPKWEEIGQALQRAEAADFIRGDDAAVVRRYGPIRNGVARLRDLPAQQPEPPASVQQAGDNLGAIFGVEDNLRSIAWEDPSLENDAITFAGRIRTTQQQEERGVLTPEEAQADYEAIAREMHDLSQRSTGDDAAQMETLADNLAEAVGISNTAEPGPSASATETPGSINEELLRATGNLSEDETANGAYENLPRNIDRSLQELEDDPNSEIDIDMLVDDMTQLAQLLEHDDMDSYGQAYRDAADAISRVRARQNAPAAEAPAAPEAPATPEAPAEAPGVPPRPAGAPTDRVTRYDPAGVATNRRGQEIYAGLRVQANDGNWGEVISVQQEPPYARIRFDDGTVRVRSARTLGVASSPDQGRPTPLPSTPEAPPVPEPPPTPDVPPAPPAAPAARPAGPAIPPRADGGGMQPWRPMFPAREQPQNFPLEPDSGADEERSQMENWEAELAGVEPGLPQPDEAIDAARQRDAEAPAAPEAPATPEAPAAPNVDDQITRLQEIADGIPRRGPSVYQDRVRGNYRNAGYALREALDNFARGDADAGNAMLVRAESRLRAGGYAEVAQEVQSLREALNGTGPDVPAAPAAPAAPAEPGAPEAAPFAGNADGVSRAQEIERMHAAGALAGYPLVPAVGSARSELKDAIQAGREGDDERYAEHLESARALYERALQNGIDHAGLGADVPNRLRAVEQLIADHQAGHIQLGGAPEAAQPEVQPTRRATSIPRNQRIELSNIRSLLPRVVGRTRNRRALAERQAGFAIQFALRADARGQLDRRDSELLRAEQELLNAGRLDLSRQVGSMALTLRGGAGAPSPGAPNAPAAPRQRTARQTNAGDFPAHDWVDVPLPEPGPDMYDEETANVSDPHSAQAHVKAPNPTAVQSDYAAWGSRSGEIARAARVRPSVESIVDSTISDAEAKRLVEQAFGAETVKYGSAEYTLRPSSISRAPANAYSGANIHASFAIVDQNGRQVGSVTRSLTQKRVLNPATGQYELGDWTAYNSSMRISDRSARQSGFSTAINRHMENWYIANNFSSVSVSAAGGQGYTGAFVWAMQGFHWDGMGFGEVETRLASMGRQASTDGEREQIRVMKERVANARRLYNSSTTPEEQARYLSAEYTPSPMELALIGWKPGAGTWLGKTYMTGNGWGGRKDLTKPSKNYAQREAFNAQRAAAQRASNGEGRVGMTPEAVTALTSGNVAAEVDGVTPPGAEYLAPRMNAIREHLTSNTSLAAMPTQVKNALRGYVNFQLGRAGTSMAGKPDGYVQELEKLARALEEERRADYPDQRPLGPVGEELSHFSLDALRGGRVPGFSVTNLGMRRMGGEGGNSGETFRLVHNASGRVFYAKSDDAGLHFGRTRTGASRNSELDINTLLRESGWAGVGEYQPGQDHTVVVMANAGDGVDLVSRPVPAGRAGVPLDQILGNLARPDDLLRMYALDVAIGNGDRHEMNFNVAQDRNGQWWLFPVDHGLSGGGGGWAHTTMDPNTLAAFLLNAPPYRGAYGDAGDPVFLREAIRRMGVTRARGVVAQALQDYRNALSTGQYVDPNFVSQLTGYIDRILQDPDVILTPVVP